MDFRSLKTDLNMEMLRCKSPDMIEKEIAVRFIAYNLIRANIAESSTIHNKIARQVSFKSAVQILGAARGRFEHVRNKISKNAYAAIAKAIVSTLIGKRKRPSQPRAVKRRPKPYPLLTVPRAEACCGLINDKF